MPEPSVTAVVPTHNRPELMRAAVRSIVEQDYAGHIETIIVFDACDVDVPDLKLPANRTVHGVANDRTRGLAGARNTGIAKASGDLVAFLDDDDEWLPGKMRRQVTLLAERPEAIMVASAMVIVSDGVRIARPMPTNLLTHAHLLRDRMGGSLPSGSFVYRRDALVELGMLDEQLPGSYGEDWDLLLRTAQIAPVPVIADPLVSVRWSEESFFFGQWERYAVAMTYLRDKHPGFAADPAAAAALEAKIAFAWASIDRRAEARAAARRALRHRPTQVKALLALVISTGLVRAATITKVARRLGRGV